VEKPMRAADMVVAAAKNYGKSAKRTGTQHAGRGRPRKEGKTGQPEVGPAKRYEIETPHIESLVVRVESRHRKGESKLVRVNLAEGMIVDEDECTFKCVEVAE
jgi:hypothetical protein